MNMRAFLILVLRITFVTFCSTEGEQGKEGGGGGGQATVPCITCSFMGLDEPVNYKMKVEDIPARCENILFGVYSWDMEFPAADAQAIKSLVDNGKSVYTVSGYYNEPTPWVEMMTTDTRNDVIEQMATFMKDNSISGVVLDMTNLYTLNQTDLAVHMNTLLCKIKQCYSSLVIGMLVSGLDYEKWADTNLFDFTAVDVDFILIDTEALNKDCDIGVCRRLTADLLENVAQSSSAAGMTSKNLLMSFGIRVSWISNDTYQISKDYSEYCCPNEKDPKGDWYCPDSVEIFYEQAQFAKKNSKGIFLTALNKDDYKGSCGCGPFPVANAYIDGWNSIKSTCCIPQSP